MSAAVGSSSHTSQEPDVTTNTTTNHRTRRNLISFRHLICLTIMIVLSAAGTISISDISFVLFSILYMYYISKVAFPLTSQRSDPPVFGADNKILTVYVSAAAVVGLLLPIAYIIGGVFAGDEDGIRSAAPHLFLLASQVFMEGISFSGNFSLPVRVFVPVFYNSKRIFTIVEWIRSEFYRSDVGYGVYVGRGLAVVNMALWSFNLFGFLLPVFLPKAFRIYYSKHK